jgi:ribosomal 30S subunit maturation factor RimM
LNNDAESGWVAIAQLGKTRGNRGEVTAVALSSKPERYQALREVFLFAADGSAGGEKYEIESTWFHGGTLVFKYPDGKSETENLVPGGVGFREANVSHDPFNPGSSQVRVIEVELK